MKEHTMAMALAITVLLAFLPAVSAWEITASKPIPTFFNKRFDYSVSYEGLGMFAKKCDPNWNNPVPLNAPIPTCNGQLTDTTFDSGLDASDDLYVVNNDNFVDSWQVFYADLSENTTKIMRLKWTWEGSTTYSYSNLMKLMVWNSETNSWEEVATSSGKIDETKTISMNNPERYITSDNKTYFLMYNQHSGGYEQPRTDVVTLTVSYSLIEEAPPAQPKERD